MATAAHAPTGGLPILLHASRIRALCVGGGAVAAAKTAPFIEQGATVRVVAPRVGRRLRDAADAGQVDWRSRTFTAADIGDAHLVIAATDVATVNAAVAEAADAVGRLCVRVDDGLAGTAAMMGVVRRDPLVLGVATGGAAPALARLLRRELSEHYGPEHGELVALCGELRADADVRAALATLDPEQRRARWRKVYHPDILAFIRAGRPDQAKEAAFACLSSSSD